MDKHIRKMVKRENNWSTRRKTSNNKNSAIAQNLCSVDEDTHHQRWNSNGHYNLKIMDSFS